MAEGFFETQSRLTAKRAAATPSGMAAPLTVTQLTRKIEGAIKTGVPAAVAVRGEISNFRPQRTGSGHLYFTLKDSTACIDCVTWKDDAAKLKFNLVDGLEVLASGRVGVYAERGKYQLYVNALSPIGQGALELAFQQMRAKLEREGLFAAERKKPLPTYPVRIAIVTSSATAALQDILKVLRRFAWLRLSLYHVPVQGNGAGEQIAAALKRLGNSGRFDVILLGRGGGSLEDLWAFNEEAVARAMAACAIPIVTGIGHEVDTSIADLVADHHAHTPTEAAQTITAHWRNASELIGVSSARMNRAMRQIVQELRQRLIGIARHEVFRRPLDRINVKRQFLDERQRAMAMAMADAMRERAAKLAEAETRWAHRHPRHALSLHRARLDAMQGQLRRTTMELNRRRTARLEALAAHLNAIGPEQVLRRGYTITTRKKDGRPLRLATEARIGETIVTRLADGTVESVVGDPRQPSLF